MNKKLILAVVVLAGTLLSCQLSGAVPVQSVIPTQAVQLTNQPSADLVSQQDTLIAIYQRVNPGVVAIKTYDESGSPVGLGSGWVYDTDGNIVTNDHVVEGANQFEIDFTSGFKAYGELVGVDSQSDLAVIKVDAPVEELHPLSLGDNSQLKVGQVVMAIGNPFGFSSTMTTGIVSALGRALPSSYTNTTSGFYSAGDVIQTDAALNPGNSGGPLLNLNGEVVGVNQSIYTSTSTSTGEPVNSGIGFAISVNIVKRVVPGIIQNGEYEYPYLGVTTINDDIFSLPVVEALGLTQFSGAYVTSVVAGGPAETAGIQAGTEPTSIEGLFAGGDLIVAIDGQEVTGFDDMISYLYNKSPGDSVVLTVLRGAERVDVTITLGTRP